MGYGTVNIGNPVNKDELALRNHDHAPSDLTEPVPITKGGTGAETAAEARSKLGVAAKNHNQGASTITAGTLGGKVVAKADAVSALSAKQVRNIYAGTADLTAGESALPSGDIYLVYE